MAVMPKHRVKSITIFILSGATRINRPLARANDFKFYSMNPSVFLSCKFYALFILKIHNAVLSPTLSFQARSPSCEQLKIPFVTRAG